MKQYDSYKDSGVQWIGEIPSHWKVGRLKFTGNFGNGLTYSPNDVTDSNGILVLRSSNIKSNHLAFDDCVYVKSANKELMVQKGDIIICSRNGSANLVGKCAYVESSIHATFGAFMMRYKPSISNRFAFYLFQSATDYYKGLFSTTTINQLTSGIINQMVVPYLPLAEQQAIAIHLDKKCAEIDKAIATQQKRIELLQELRQNIITHAVTRGINPDASLKDSGVEWIGMVPEHWEIMMLKRCATIKTGCTPPTKEEKYYEADDIDWFTPGDIGDDCIEEAEKKISDSARKEGVCRMFPPYSVYFVGIGATIGKVSYCDIEASANQQINAIIPNNRANYKYITYCLKSQKEEIFLTANTVTLPIINQERTGSLRIPVPPLKEQQAIVAYIESETAKLDKQVAMANRQISLLKELKQSIITEVVTGKRKVC